MLHSAATAAEVLRRVSPNDLEPFKNFPREGCTSAAPRMPANIQFLSLIDTLAEFTGLPSRRCARCEPAARSTRHAPFVVDCTTCGCTYYGPRDVTDEIPPIPPSGSRDDER